MRFKNEFYNLIKEVQQPKDASLKIYLPKCVQNIDIILVSTNFSTFPLVSWTTFANNTPSASNDENGRTPNFLSFLSRHFS